MTPTVEAQGPRTRPMLRRPTWSHNQLARACALAPQILAIHSESVPRCARGAVVCSAQLTSTGVAVVVLAPVGELPCAVIKMPTTPGAARGLARETAILAALHREWRLGRWRELLPHPHAHGNLGGQSYRVDSALTGRPVLKFAPGAGGHGTQLNMAAEAIGVLHQTTRSALSVNLDVAELWVDVHVRELARHTARRGSMAMRLQRLGDELHDAVASPTFSAGWIHGDYWLGNLLFSGAGATAQAPDGIVDWDAAAPLELALHDLLHLLLYTRRLSTGRELGHIVRSQILGGEWSAGEAAVLDRHATWRQDGSLSERHALLLYWLRQTAMHARQQTAPVGSRYRVWERRNVLPVVALL